jgi:bifunctional non-homologous end joining protein LigD
MPACDVLRWLDMPFANRRKTRPVDKTPEKIVETLVKRTRRSGGKTNSHAARANERLKGEKSSPPAGAAKAPLPETIDVELATLEPRVPNGAEWLHEIKFDGYRLICKVNRGKAMLITRRHQDWTHRYRLVATAAAELPVNSVVLDGELVALLTSGVSSFQALQNAGKLGSNAKLVYFVFDLLYLDGYDCRPLPLEQRKERLKGLLAEAHSSVIQYSDHFDENGAAFLKESCRAGLEGIISKRRDRPYVSGRSGDWVKIKCLGREELVIGGYTLSTADRRGIGALLVGFFKSGELIYAGRVGTGFNAQTLLEMRQRLEKLRQERCPFASVPSKERGPLVKWVRPKLVAEIQFSTWTEAGILRHPSFQGLREDKAASDVGQPASLKLAISG